MGSRGRNPPAWNLWHPRQAIVFAAGQQEPLYPRLDMSRFLHSADAKTDRVTQPCGDVPIRAGPSSHEAEHRSDYFPPPRSQCTPAELWATAAQAGEQQGAGKTPAEEGKEAEEAGEEDDSDEPPSTSLDFKIPEDAFRAARLAAPGTPESFWSYTLYRGPGDDGPESSKVKVHYCRSKRTVERVCRYFLDEKVIGFDLEWVPQASKAQGTRRNVSLVQLASPSRIALFHLALFPTKDDFAVPSFKSLMEDPGVTKTGVFIKGDCKRLRDFLGIESRAIFELSHLYKLVKYCSSGEHRLINKKLVALATQVQDHLRLPMFKGQDVRASDWSKPLDMDQIICESDLVDAAKGLLLILGQTRHQMLMPPSSCSTSWIRCARTWTHVLHGHITQSSICPFDCPMA